MNSTESTLQEVEMSKIFNSKTNPRKTFDEVSMKELQESISKVGVLQPILLRKHPTARTGDKFELVCGERRYRAATLAGLKTIPANIRELTDDEAFEMQIIENLERKDVHPLEEAEAFKRMLDSGKYTIADIAAKFAKPETFIAQRLKLVDLIDELKQEFYDGKIGIGHAVLLARLDPGTQKQQYDEANEEGSWTEGYGTVQQLKDNIEGELYNLNIAPFDLNDDTFKGATACAVCPKRSGANPILFPDIEEKDICHDRACYRSKMNQFLEREVAAIIRDGLDIHIGLGWNSKAPDFIVEMCKQHNIPILTDDDYRKAYNENELKDAPKLLLVGGHNIGKTIPVYINRSAQSKSETASEPDIGEQIRKIEERAKRALELDNVKVFQAIKEDPKLFDEYLHNNNPLTDLETKAMWYLFDQKVLGYHASDRYRKLVNKPDSYGDLKAFEFFKDTPLEELKTNQLVRMAIKSQLTTMHEPNYDKCTNSRFYIEIIQEQYPNLVKAKIDSQNEIAQKRIDRTNKKLEELKADLPEEKTVKKAKVKE